VRALNVIKNGPLCTLSTAVGVPAAVRFAARIVLQQSDVSAVIDSGTFRAIITSPPRTYRVFYRFPAPPVVGGDKRYPAIDRNRIRRRIVRHRALVNYGTRLCR